MSLDDDLLLGILSPHGRRILDAQFRRRWVAATMFHSGSNFLVAVESMNWR